MLLFILSFGVNLFAQTTCECPEYKDGQTLLSNLIKKSFPPISERDSFPIVFSLDIANGQLISTEVSGGENQILPKSSLAQLESIKNNWEIAADSTFLNTNYLLKIKYTFPQGHMLCTKRELYPSLPLDISGCIIFEDSTDVYELFDVSEMAKFRNGHEDLVAFLDSSLTWPSAMGMICGNWNINVMFVVEADGTISSVQTLGSKKGFGLDEEAVRVIKLTSGLWTPALQRDKKVRMRMRVPVRFER